MRIIKRLLSQQLLRLLGLTSIGLCLSMSSFAHHSWSEFDAKLPIKVAGAVTKLEWKSPHARLYVDVVTENGETVNWNFELPSPNTLMRRGWSRKSLAAGDMVTVEGIRARNFSDIGIVSSILNEQDEPMFTGATPVYEP